MTANKRQEGGSHYKDAPIQPWDVMAATFSPEQFEGYLRGNALKYIMRYTAKGGLEDVKKAHHYLERLIEHLEAAKPADEVLCTEEDEGFVGHAGIGLRRPRKPIPPEVAVKMKEVLNRIAETPFNPNDWEGCGPKEGSITYYLNHKTGERISAAEFTKRSNQRLGKKAKGHTKKA